MESNKIIFITLIYYFVFTPTYITLNIFIVIYYSMYNICI